MDNPKVALNLTAVDEELHLVSQSVEAKLITDRRDPDATTHWICFKFKHYRKALVFLISFLLFLVVLGLNVLGQVEIFKISEQYLAYGSGFSSQDLTKQPWSLKCVTEEIDPVDAMPGNATIKHVY